MFCWLLLVGGRGIFAQTKDEMISLFETNEEKESFISTYQNPFDKDSVECISFWITKELFSNKTKYYANIEFKKGDTTGEHKVRANNFPELVSLVEQFIKSL